MPRLEPAPARASRTAAPTPPAVAAVDREGTGGRAEGGERRTPGPREAARNRRAEPGPREHEPEGRDQERLRPRLGEGGRSRSLGHLGGRGRRRGHGHRRRDPTAIAVTARGRSSRSRGGASFARSISSSGWTRSPSSCLATSFRPMRPRSLSTSWTITRACRRARSRPRCGRRARGDSLETCNKPSVPFFSSTKAPNSVVLTTRPVYVSPTSGVLVSASIAAIAESDFLALGRVDQDRAVLLDIDLDVVVALERADRLAALADHEPDLLGVDLDRRDPRSVQRRAGGGSPAAPRPSCRG